MATRKIIMIVDDDPDDRAFFCEALSEVDASIECICLKGGEEAIEHLEESSNEFPDFIFLDLNMPRMDGKQCLKQLKSNSNLSSIPVVIYTTSKSKEDIEETKDDQEEESIRPLGRSPSRRMSEAFNKLQLEYLEQSGEYR